MILEHFFNRILNIFSMSTANNIKMRHSLGDNYLFSVHENCDSISEPQKKDPQKSDS